MQALAGPYKGEDLREQLEERVNEHASWVEANTSAQLAAYTNFVQSRTGSDSASSADSPESPSNSNGASGAEDTGSAEVKLDVFDGGKPKSLELLDGLDVSETTADLEGRVRDVVRSSILQSCNDMT